LVYPSFAPKYATHQNEKPQKKSTIDNKNQLLVPKVREFLVAALTIPDIVAAIAKRFIRSAIRAVSLGPDPKSRNLILFGISVIFITSFLSFILKA